MAKNCDILNNSEWHHPFFEFSKYLVHFWCANTLINSSTLRCPSVKYFSVDFCQNTLSSVGTPLSSRNWRGGSTSFQFGSSLNIIRIKQEIFHRFNLHAQMLYTHAVHTIYSIREYIKPFIKCLSIFLCQ